MKVGKSQSLGVGQLMKKIENSKRVQFGTMVVNIM